MTDKQRRTRKRRERERKRKWGYGVGDGGGGAGVSYTYNQFPRKCFEKRKRRPARGSKLSFTKRQAPVALASKMAATAAYTDQKHSLPTFSPSQMFQHEKSSSLEKQCLSFHPITKF